MFLRKSPAVSAKKCSSGETALCRHECIDQKAPASHARLHTPLLGTAARAPHDAHSRIDNHHDCRGLATCVPIQHLLSSQCFHRHVSRDRWPLGRHRKAPLGSLAATFRMQIQGDDVILGNKQSFRANGAHRARAFSVPERQHHDGPCGPRLRREISERLHDSIARLP